MKKEDVATVAKALSNIKDYLNELDIAFRNKDEVKVSSLKIKIFDLQSQIGRML